jgi:hypothetical protein
MSNDNPFEVSSESYGDRSGVDRDTSSAEVSRRTIELLNQTRPWVQLIGVLTWIGVVIAALATIALVGLALAAGGIGPRLLMGVLYGFITFIYWFIAKSLTGYASRINRLSASESVRDLEDALESQKNFWKTVGILTLVMILIYIVMIVLFFLGIGFMQNLFQQQPGF